MNVSDWLVGIDTGGTFTDLIGIDKGGKIVINKIPSTPSNPSNAVISALDCVDRQISEVIHGTTVATNAVLQKKGAKIALITTKGFRDILEIGRQNRLDIYEIVPSRPEALVDRMYRLEIEERVIADGSIETELSKKELDRITADIQSLIDNETIEGVAISLLFSFLNPKNEQLILAALESKLNSDDSLFPISISSNVMPEYREYERTSTTVIDVYVKPLISTYIQDLNNRIKETGRIGSLSIMKSSAGLITPEGVTNKPVETLVSGLAGGIQAAELTSRLTKYQDLLSLDIGGTSTDVAQIIEGKGKIHHQFNIDNYPVGTASVDVVTIGAGGGSIASFSAGLLKVGPESASADPGPAAYDMGGEEVTTTDADLLYGILPDFLGDNILELKSKLSENVMKRLASEMKISVKETINGVRRIFHENIAAALRSVSTERGVDPRNFALLAFGGAGPVHAVELAELLTMKLIIIPPYPGIWSAFGLVGADYRYDLARGVVKSISNLNDNEAKLIFDELKQKVFTQAKEDGIDLTLDYHFQYSLNMRFKGQSFDLEIPYAESLENTSADFINIHRQTYGFAAEDEEIELVAFRMVLVIAHPDPVFHKWSIVDEVINPVGTRDILGIGAVPVFNKSQFGWKTKITGPAIIDQIDTTTWLPPNWHLEVDEYGFMILEKEELK
jgi:N-methylhydantoinase A